MATKQKGVNPAAFGLPIGAMATMFALTFAVSYFEKSDQNFDTRSKAADPYPPTPTVAPTPTGGLNAPCPGGATECCYYDVATYKKYYKSVQNGVWKPPAYCPNGCFSGVPNGNTGIMTNVGCRCDYLGQKYRPYDSICSTDKTLVKSCASSTSGLFTDTPCAPRLCTDTTDSTDPVWQGERTATCSLGPTVTGAPQPTAVPTVAKYGKTIAIQGCKYSSCKQYITCTGECSKYPRPDNKPFTCVSIGTDSGGTNKSYYATVNLNTKTCTPPTVSSASGNGCIQVLNNAQTGIRCPVTNLPPQSTICRCE
jgi:hypothetical protein